MERKKLDMLIVEDVSVRGRSGNHYDFTLLYHWDGWRLTPMAVLKGIHKLCSIEPDWGLHKLVYEAQEIGGFNLDPEDYCYPQMYHATQSYRLQGYKDVSVGVYTVKQFAEREGWVMYEGRYYIVPAVVACDVIDSVFNSPKISPVIIPAI